MVVDLDQGGRRPQGHRTYLGPSLGWCLTDEPTYVEVVIGSGAVLQTGVKGYAVMKEYLIIHDWVLLSNAAGNVIMDIWKLPLATVLAGTLPSASNSITGTNKPQLSSQFAASSAVLSNWNTLLEPDDVLAFNVDLALVLTRVSLILRCTRLLGQF